MKAIQEARAMTIQGTVFKYRHNIDTDVIIPARYLNTSDPAELARHCLEDLDPTFVRNVRKGDIIVAGRNFGCGSSREHAPLAIKTAGISCVIAASFARIFYRNAINIGLPILESAEASAGVENGDALAVDFRTGVIQNITQNRAYRALPFPDFIRDIVAAGGLIPCLRRALSGKKGKKQERIEP